MTSGGFVEQLLIKSIEQFGAARTENIMASVALRDGIGQGNLKDPDWVLNVLRNTQDQGGTHE